MKAFDMRIHFGFAGFADETMRTAACNKITALMHEFLCNAQQYNCAEYGFSAQPVRCDLYSADVLCSDEFYSIAESISATTNMVLSSFDPTLQQTRADAIIGLDMKKESLSYPGTVAEYVVNKSDAVFLLWDGKQSFGDGILWSVLQFCKQKRIPYYLINTQNLDEVSFSFDSYYVPYRSEDVNAYVQRLYAHREKPLLDCKIPLSGLWLKLHGRFIKKYNMKAKNVPYVEDKLLSGNCFSDDTPISRNHAMLCDYFNYYDKKANEASELYRASVYFRSVLPMITTVFIAIGFYAETVLGFIFGKPMFFNLGLWTIIAGVGFLIHALLNRYAGKTAKNPKVDRLRKDFAEARFIAEYLRIAIHGEAYGIQITNPLSDSTVADDYIRSRLHHIIRSQEPASYIQTAQTIASSVADFEKLVADQTAYHANCINRYSLIASRLKKMAVAVHSAGFFIVVARGFLQFFLPFITSLSNFSQDVHGIKVESFTKSFANMLALVLPAWASYFSSKLNMNGYEWLLKNSQQMKNGLETAQKKLNGTKAQKHSYQAIGDVANDIMSLTLADYSGWYQRMDSQKFTRL